MPVELIQWRAKIGLFIMCLQNKLPLSSNVRSKSLFKIVFLLFLLLFDYLINFDLSYSSTAIQPILCYNIDLRKINFLLFNLCFILFNYNILLLLDGDVELNPGPRDTYNFSFFYWNLNSIMAYDFLKLDLLKRYNTLHN